MRVRTPIAVCFVLALLMALGCSPAKAPAGEQIPSEYASMRMLGAGMGSKTTATYMVLAKVLNKYYPEIEWGSASGATITNAVYITDGTLKLGSVVPAAYVQAYGYDKMKESRLRSIILPSWINNYVFHIPEDKPWKDITEVPKGSSLCPGAAGTTNPVACEAWLKLCGLSPKDFNWLPMADGAMADAWRAGKIDLAFGALAGIEPLLIDLHATPRKSKVMGLSPEQVKKAQDERTFEKQGFTFLGMSGLVETTGGMIKQDVMCPKQGNMLTCRDDFPDNIGYRMARVFDEHNSEMVEMFAILKAATPQYHVKYAGPPLEIHSGVAKYYREKGYLK